MEVRGCWTSPCDVVIPSFRLSGKGVNIFIDHRSVEASIDAVVVGEVCSIEERIIEHHPLKIVIGSNAEIREIDFSCCRRGCFNCQHIDIEFIESSRNEVAVCIVEKRKHLKG